MTTTKTNRERQEGKKCLWLVVAGEIDREIERESICVCVCYFLFILLYYTGREGYRNNSLFSDKIFK